MTESDTPAPPPLDLRAARVIDAMKHPNADRLLVLRIDLGGETRQIIAGIAQHYEPEELTGRTIVVVANLQAARLRGEVSQGMLLAAQGDAGESDGPALGLVETDAAPGTRLTTPAMGGAGPGEITIDDFAAHELRATGDGVLVDGEPLGGAAVRVDRGVTGTVR